VSFCALALLALLAAYFPMSLQAAQLGGSAEHSLPLGRQTPETVVRRIVRAMAWLDALDKAAAALSAASLARLGGDEAAGVMALASAVSTPAVRSTSKGQRVFVEVRLNTPQRTVEERLRKILPEREILELRAGMLERERKILAEARSLIELPAVLRQSLPEGSAAYGARLSALAAQLEALWLLGRVLPQREAGRWREAPEALSALQQAEALDPGHGPLLYLQGELLLQLDRPQDALAMLDKALTLSPELAGALYARGVAYLRLQLPSLAEHDLSAALERDSSRADWWRARGALYMIQKKTGPMCADFAQACARGDCEGLAAARGRGLCLAEQ
jgi:tetratricopeptide (TPR) repeat protein